MSKTNATSNLVTLADSELDAVCGGMGFMPMWWQYLDICMTTMNNAVIDGNKNGVGGNGYEGPTTCQTTY